MWCNIEIGIDGFMNSTFHGNECFATMCKQSPDLCPHTTPLYDFREIWYVSSKHIRAHTYTQDVSQVNGFLLLLLHSKH
jgi:hypothetical protein